MPTRKLAVFLLMPLILFALPVHAYIGPGAGVGTIAVVLGILASIVMAFFAILWYPMKRLLKKRKVKERKVAKQALEEASSDTQGKLDNS